MVMQLETLFTKLQANQTQGNKVRDLLVRSKLSGSDLMHIW